MTPAQKETLIDDLVNLMKKVYEDSEYEVQISDYKKFIEDNPEKDRIPVTFTIHKPVKCIKVEYQI